ncbi:hypothetical protein [Pseudochrobactrum kiredjianiae]|uniref:Uncharacterized protein n=1 Tax=Pseudochrobactrum kiredjianiae TaxID=386305 RepID=A0ABW3V2W2_9HYPH|nr:hypothetical protein [Pseudochrobactrum kiredjianiae]MDM7852298.1 hypothetical protein [Pseudochrobactrum kiredjianiae]
MAKDVLRFFFDYGAGGCLWAGDTATRDRLDIGPVDAVAFDCEGRVSKPACVELSELAQSLRDQLDFEHSCYLNPLYPPDPSLWTQALCESFNTNVDRLLAILRHEIGKDYEILDEQIRYVEDPQLDDYLAVNPGLTRLNEVKVRTVR